jgi:hypothetical protein
VIVAGYILLCGRIGIPDEDLELFQTVSDAVNYIQHARAAAA